MHSKVCKNEGRIDILYLAAYFNSLKKVFKSFCLSSQYWIEELETMTNIDWKKDWMSEVYFQSNGIKEVSKEYYTYESSDLLGDFGGYLGLFLGWSLLGLSQGVFTVCSNVLRSRIPPLHKMT